MNLFDPLLIVSVLVVLTCVFGMVQGLIARRFDRVRRLGVVLATYVGAYAIILVLVSLLGPQRVVPMHEPRCFDDWCLSVEGVERRAAIGTVRARGTFWLVTVEVSSRARRVSQRARDAAVYLVDPRGRRIDPSPYGQRALESASGAGEPLDSTVDAGESFTHTVVFDVPVDVTELGLVTAHGTFPGRIVIGDDQSFLHRPTIVGLPAP